MRISQEDDVLKKVFARDPAFGSSRYQTFLIDGGWDAWLYQGGLVGLALHLVVLELYPLALLLARPGRAEAVSPAWALMLFLTLTAIDGLHNNPHFTPEALALGSLVGLATAPEGATARRRGPARTGSGTVAEGGPHVGPAAMWPLCAACLRRLMARDLSDAPTGSPGSLPRHFYSLDVLRGLAALAIVFWHWNAFYDGGPESPPFAMERQPLYVLFWPLYSYGGTAVDLFFCLSGFIFYWLYGPDVSRGAVPAREFAVLRFSRLYPLHLLTLCLVAVGQATYRARHGWFFVYEFNDPYHFVLQLLFASSWGFERGFSFDGPVWSVSVEVALYFAFFVACRLGLRRWWHLALLVVAGHLVRVGVHSSLGRGIFCFFIGGLCFYAVERLHRKGLARTALPWVVAALGVAIPVLPWLTNYCRRAAAGESPTGRPTTLGGYLVALGAGHLRFLSTAAVIFPLLIMTLALIETRRGTLGKRLSFLGHVSYSSYLLHFPLQLGFVLAGSSLAAGSAFYDSPAALVVFFGTLIPLSLSSYWFFERPSQSFLRARLISPCRRPVAAGPPPGAGHRAARLAVAIALLAVPELLGLVTGHPPSRSRSVREKDQGEAGPVPGSPDRPPPAEASGGRPDDDLLRRVREYLEKDKAAGGYREKGGVRP